MRLLKAKVVVILRLFFPLFWRFEEFGAIEQSKRDVKIVENVFCGDGEIRNKRFFLSRQTAAECK